jgi:hypothetical protein
VSIHADDEFNLRLALDSELDDVTPHAGLADLVIARYRKGRRRRFAGVVGLFVVFVGIGLGVTMPLYIQAVQSAVQEGAEPTAKTVDELKKLNLPAGVDIEIKI